MHSKRLKSRLQKRMLKTLWCQVYKFRSSRAVASVTYSIWSCSLERQLMRRLVSGLPGSRLLPGALSMSSQWRSSVSSLFRRLTVTSFSRSEHSLSASRLKLGQVSSQRRLDSKLKPLSSQDRQVRSLRK